jgi:hypothetical protein
VITYGPRFDHLARLTDRRGTFEHADHTTPRPEHGYCTDDMARVLVVTSREPEPGPVVRALARTALGFLVDAQGARGDCRNRLSSAGVWLDRFGVEDCWGRSVWGFGTAAARSPDEAIRMRALAHFECGIRQRSTWPRAMAFAALGADEVLCVSPDHAGARALLSDAVDVMAGEARAVPGWDWPEPRLSYANAVLPEAMVAAGVALERACLVDDGLEWLAWLVESETRDGHLSVTPVGGRGPGDLVPGFDQQPIEVAALADACARAVRLTGAERWRAGVASAVAWFCGDNDARAIMLDHHSGGGYDGLRADGPNLNQGAESTLASISTLQYARGDIVSVR